MAPVSGWMNWPLDAPEGDFVARTSRDGAAVVFFSAKRPPTRCRVEMVKGIPFNGLPASRWFRLLCGTTQSVKKTEYDSEIAV